MREPPFWVITCLLAFVCWWPQMRVICAVWQKASAGAARLMAWACTAEYVDDKHPGPRGAPLSFGHRGNSWPLTRTAELRKRAI